MNFLDRRFLNLSLSVLSVANQPDANPAVGSQYIVGSNPSGAFASASANQIARYNGSNWQFFTPKIRELEVLNLNSGEFLQFNGSAWVTVASLSAGSNNPSGANIITIDGIAAGYNNNPSSSYLTPGNFLLADHSKCYFNIIRNNSTTWYSYPLHNGASFICWDGIDSYKLYSADDESNNGWMISDVSEGAIFFNRADSSIYALLNGEVSKISNGIIVFDGFVTSGYSGLLDDVPGDLPDNPNQGDIFIPLEYLESIGEEGPSLLVADSNNDWSEDYFPSWQDTCYVSTNHQYLFRWNARSENRDERFLCIHPLNYLDILFDVIHDKFYRRHGNSFVCLNDTPISSQQASASEPIAPVLRIIQTASSLPASCAVGDTILNTSDAKIYTATAADTWNSGVITANGARYASSTDHKIYSSNGSALSDDPIPTGGIFLNKDDNFLYVYDGSNFIKASNDSVSVPVFVTEAHSLTAAEVSAKSFSLSNSIASGQENNTLLFVSGIAQIVGSDFNASGNSISWNSKGLDSIGLIAGDSFLVQYLRA